MAAGWICRSCGYQGDWPNPSQPWTDLDKPMSIICCQDCNTNWSIPDAMVAPGEADKSIVRKLVQGRMLGWDGKEAPTSSEILLGVCDPCKRIARAASQAPRKRQTVEEEGADIQHRIWEIRKQRPELTPEQVAHAAVEEHTEYYDSVHPAFKQWLRDRER